VISKSDREHKHHYTKNDWCQPGSCTEAVLGLQPPARWHMGIAPNGLSNTFARPDDRARLRFARDRSRREEEFP